MALIEMDLPEDFADKFRETALDKHTAKLAFAQAQINYSNCLNRVIKREQALWAELSKQLGVDFGQEHWYVDSRTGKLFKDDK